MAKAPKRSRPFNWGNKRRRKVNRPSSSCGCSATPGSSKSTESSCGCGPPSVRTAVVVLGHRLNRDGSPTAILASRVEACVGLADGDDVACIVLSGGDAARVGKSEARAMKELYLAIRTGGEPPAAGGGAEPEMVPEVILEEGSASTVWNAIFCLPLLRYKGVGRVVLVTSDFHMPRAAMTFEAICPEMEVSRHPVPIPVPYPHDLHGVDKALSPLDRMRQEYDFCRDPKRLSNYLVGQARSVGLVPNQRARQCRDELEEIMNATHGNHDKTALIHVDYSKTADHDKDEEDTPVEVHV